LVKPEFPRIGVRVRRRVPLGHWKLDHGVIAYQRGGDRKFLFRYENGAEGWFTGEQILADGWEEED
jgi:hypothetical protein